MAERTLVTFLLDRTGSMSQIKQDTIGAFNEYVSTLKDTDGGDNGEVDFTFVTFDSVSIDKICVGVPIKDAPELNDKNYVPRGWTPLIDAAYKTIKATEAAAKDRKVVICIQTDGEENASTEYTWAQLNGLIKEKMAAGWQFNFMGASIDAYKQATAMGLSAAQTMSYNAQDAGQTRMAFGASARNTRSFASGQSLHTNYSALDKSNAGDAFDPGLAKAQQTRAQATAAKPTKVVDDFSLDK